MQEKRSLLVVGDYNRKDFIEPFYACRSDFEFYFIEFASKDEIKTDFYKEYGQAIFWKDFSDAYDLLKKIKPFKVVFYFIESYNQVALNVACKVLGIKTYHLDHGFLNLDRQQKMEATRLPVQNPEHGKKSAKSLVKRLITFKNRVQTRLFFKNTARKSAGALKLFLKKYYQTRKSNTISQTFQKINSPFRIADEYISYGQANFKQIIKRDHLKARYPVHYTGVPNFDKWAQIKPAPDLKNYIIFIPQPFAEQGWLGWTYEYEKQFINELVQVCKDARFKLYVKLHPYQNAAIWKEYAQKQELQIITDNDLTELLPFTKVVIGFYSTLLFFLAALPHLVILTFENHPIKNIRPSAIFETERVCTTVKNIKDLKKHLHIIKCLLTEQKKYKDRYLKKWLTDLSGQGGLKLRNILLE